jgi:hypothetical protein
MSIEADCAREVERGKEVRERIISVCQEIAEDARRTVADCEAAIDRCREAIDKLAATNRNPTEEGEKP